MTAPDAPPLAGDDLDAVERLAEIATTCGGCGAQGRLLLPRLVRFVEEFRASRAEVRASQAREAAAHARGRESMRAEAVAACVAIALRYPVSDRAEECAEAVLALPATRGG